MTVNQSNCEEDLRDDLGAGRGACLGAPRPGGGADDAFFAMVPVPNLAVTTPR